MKEAINKNKKFIIIAIVIVVLLLIGIAFAYLVTTLNGEKEYLVRAGSLGLKLEEGNELTLEKQIPLTDEDGMSLDGFNFSLVNEGNIETDYTIYLDDIPLNEGETRIPDSSIRYSLTRNDETFSTKNLTTMGSNPNRRLDFGTIGVGETINYTLKIWIDYDATTEEASGKVFKGKLRVVASQVTGEKTGTVLLENIPEENLYDDGTDTFITGEDPNNYIWYSGKLWRAVYVNNEEKTVKLITDSNISALPYDNDSSTFEGSYMEEWLNDTTVDGFLGNLRDYENFIVTDAKWNATLMTDESKPPSTTIVEDPVGLLNTYEYTMSYNGTAPSDGYLNIGTGWVTLTPYNNNLINTVSNSGNLNTFAVNASAPFIRPSINLKDNVKIVSGNGTEEDPYRLLGDNDEQLSGTLLNTRYSGEYIEFGTGENNLYRIVSHETRGLTKITSFEPLKENGSFIQSAFGDTVNYSSNNIIGNFLNNDYLNPNNNYLTTEQINMIEDNTTWYLGTVGAGTSYKLTKYTDTTMSNITSSTTNAKVGLLRIGDLMLNQNDIYSNNMKYWILTPYTVDALHLMHSTSQSTYDRPNVEYGIKPALNLKSNVIITNGTGTKEDPFEIELAS